MWTYFAIFLSIITLIIVFIRKVFIVFKNSQEKVKINEDDILLDVKIKKKRLSKDKKENRDTLSKRGESLINAGKEDEAIKCFVQVLVIDNKHEETKKKLAILYMNKQMYSSSAALFKELIEQTKDSVYYSNLALAYYKQNLYDEAIKSYQKSIELDETRAPRYVSLCQVYRASNKPTHAIIALNKAISLDETNLDYLFLLIDLLVEVGDLKTAKKTLTKATSIDSSHDELSEFSKIIRKSEKEFMEK